MLSIEDNELLTRGGSGTPMGELMRRYWHPIAGSAEVNDENPTKEVRHLGEDLVLFRSAAGEIGLIEPSCPHRKANLSYGVPELEGIRCAYHGWLFDVSGNCIDQPSEPVGSRFKDKVKLKAYVVEELGGLVFAYLGPLPAPLLAAPPPPEPPPLPAPLPPPPAARARAPSSVPSIGWCPPRPPPPALCARPPPPPRRTSQRR